MLNLLFVFLFVLFPILTFIFTIWNNDFSAKIIEISLPTAGAILALLTASLGLAKVVFDDSQTNYKKFVNFSVFEYKPFKIVPLTNLLKNGFLNQSNFNGLKTFEDSWRNAFIINVTPEDEQTYQQNDKRFEDFFQANFLIWLSKEFGLGWDKNEDRTYMSSFGKIGSTSIGPDQKYMKHVFLRDLLPKGTNRYIDLLPETEKLDLRIPIDASIRMTKESIVVESSYGSMTLSLFKNGDAMNAYQPQTFSAQSVEKIHSTFSPLYPGKKIEELLVRNFQIVASCERKSWKRFALPSEHLWAMCKNITEATHAEFSTIEMLGRLEGR